jgi:membrane protein involved in colicin uptake
MKKLQDQLKSISRSLLALSKQVDKAFKQVDKIEAAKAAAKKAPAKKKATAKKAAPKKKAPAKKAAPKKTAAAKPVTVLDSVFNIVKRRKKGVTIPQLKKITGFNPKQLSNALYKLSKKGWVTTKSRGVYVIK